MEARIHTLITAILCISITMLTLTQSSFPPTLESGEPVLEWGSQEKVHDESGMNPSLPVEEQKDPP